MPLIMDMKKEVMHLLCFCMISNLVIILFHDNAWPSVTTIKLWRVTELGYETLPHLPDLSLIDDHFFIHLDTFFMKKIILFQRRKN